MLDTNVTPEPETPPVVVLRPTSDVPNHEQLIAMDVVQTKRYGSRRLQLIHDPHDDSRQVFTMYNNRYYKVMAFSSDLSVFIQDPHGELTKPWGKLGLDKGHWYHHASDYFLNYLIEGTTLACYLALERSELLLVKEYLQRPDLTLLN